MNKIKNINDEELQNLAEMHKHFIKKLGLEERYVTGAEIADILGFSTRTVRKWIEEMLHLYIRGLLPKLVIGTTKGYIYTDDKEIIEPIIKARIKNFKSIAYNWYYVQKRISNNENLKISDFLGVENE